MKKKELEAIIIDQKSRIETLERLVRFVLMFGKDGARITTKYYMGARTHIIEYIPKYDTAIKTYDAGLFRIELKEVGEDYIIYSQTGLYFKLSKATNEAVDITEFYAPMVKSEATAEPTEAKCDCKCKKGGKK
jgi:hypothetical protein